MSATGAAIRAAQRRQPDSTLPLRVLQAALTLLTLLAGGYCAVLLRPLVDLPVTQVQVTGRLTHLSAAQVAAAAAVAPGTRLFALPMRAVQARIEALPWVAQAEVTRRWPDTLDVSVRERQPYARWRQHGLLDDGGTAFTPAAGDLSDAQWRALPLLSGEPGHEQDVMHAWQTLSAALAGSAFALSGLTQDARGDWTAQCRSGVVLHLGVDDPTAKLALIRDTVLPTLAARLAQVAAVDLRYTNGFAVRWAADDAKPCTAAHGAGCPAGAVKAAAIHSPAAPRAAEHRKS